MTKIMTCKLGMESKCMFMHSNGPKCGQICGAAVSADNDTRCDFHNHIIFNPNTWNLTNIVLDGLGKVAVAAIYRWILDHPRQFERKFHKELLAHGCCAIIPLIMNPHNFNTYEVTPPTTANSSTPVVRDDDIPLHAQNYCKITKNNIPKERLDVTLYAENYCRTIKNNFILDFRDNDGVHSVVGRHDLETDSCVPLSKDEEFLAVEMGFIVMPHVAIVRTVGIPKKRVDVIPYPDGYCKDLSQSCQLSVVDYANGYYKDPIHNFIVRQGAPEEIIVVGRFIETINSCIPLTEQEVKLAKQIGLTIGPHVPVSPTK